MPAISFQGDRELVRAMGILAKEKDTSVGALTYEAVIEKHGEALQRILKNFPDSGTQKCQTSHKPSAKKKLTQLKGGGLSPLRVVMHRNGDYTAIFPEDAKDQLLKHVELIRRLGHEVIASGYRLTAGYSGDLPMVSFKEAES